MPRLPKSATPLSLKARAISALARRDYSRKELHQKLLGFAESEQVLSDLLSELETKKLLSNARFADALVNQRQGKFGLARLVYELEQHGLDPEIIQSQKQQLALTEHTRALAVWTKRFGVRPSTGSEKAKQMRFLASRGFSPEVFRWLEANDFSPVESSSS